MILFMIEWLWLQSLIIFDMIWKCEMHKFESTARWEKTRKYVTHFLFIIWKCEDAKFWKYIVYKIWSNMDKIWDLKNVKNNIYIWYSKMWKKKVFYDSPKMSKKLISMIWYSKNV